MINAQEVAVSLTAAQRDRILALFATRKAQRWEESDEDLKRQRLVRCFAERPRGDMTELNNDGWSVAMLLSGGAG